MSGARGKGVNEVSLSSSLPGNRLTVDGVSSTRNRAHLGSLFQEVSLLGSEQRRSGETPHHEVGSRLVRTWKISKWGKSPFSSGCHWHMSAQKHVPLPRDRWEEPAPCPRACVVRSRGFS